MKVKKVLALTLVLALVMALVPTVATGAELPKLPTPTDLEWGQGYDQIIPGCASWSMTSHAGEAEIRYYNAENDQEVVGATCRGLLEEDLKGDDGTFLCDRDYNLESGSYYFTVQLKGDGVTCEDSEIVRSATWAYTKPSAKLPTPSAPIFLPQGTVPDGWEKDEAVAFVQWEGTQGNGHEVEYFFSTTNIKNPDVTSAFVGVSAFNDNQVERLAPDDMLDLAETAGYYYARVRALSRDINKTRNSAWSPLSAPFYWDGKTVISPSPKPSTTPSAAPSSKPSAKPSTVPSAAPSVAPSSKPSTGPSAKPSTAPSVKPSAVPSAAPSVAPSSKPSTGPSTKPSTALARNPALYPVQNRVQHRASPPARAPSL